MAHDTDNLDALTAAGPTADRFVVELAADGNDPAEGPASVRLKRWLKVAMRCHGLRCQGVAPVVDPPTAAWPATNAMGKWRPRGRTIRAACRAAE